MTSDPSITVIVSAGNQPVIKVYSNPTTIKAGQSTTLEIVVTGTSGSPAPTGQFNMFLGTWMTNAITLGPGGRVEVKVTFPTVFPLDTLEVQYFGDTVYLKTDVKFPLTNPPISGGGPQPSPAPIGTTTGSSTPGTGSTPAPSSTAIASGSTPAPSSTTSANGGTAIGNQTPGAASNQGIMLFWIVLVILLVVAAGGSAAVIVLRQRARAAPTPARRTTFPRDDDW